MSAFLNYLDMVSIDVIITAFSVKFDSCFLNCNQNKKIKFIMRINCKVQIICKHSQIQYGILVHVPQLESLHTW